MTSTISGVCPRVTHSNYHSGETIAETLKNAIEKPACSRTLVVTDSSLIRTMLLHRLHLARLESELSRTRPSLGHLPAIIPAIWTFAQPARDSHHPLLDVIPGCTSSDATHHPLSRTDMCRRATPISIEVARTIITHPHWWQWLNDLKLDLSVIRKNFILLGIHLPLVVSTI